MLISENAGPKIIVIGIIKNNFFLNTKLVQKHNQFYEFNIMDANREEDLGLIQVDELDNWLYG